MTLTQITEKGIKDGEIVNADINASAAIAGSKISPAFTSDITGTGDLTLSAGGTDRLTMTHAGGGKFVIKNPSAADLAFGTANANNELVIANGGNVGINTGTPNQLLEVANSNGGATISISTDQQPGSVSSKKYNNLDFTGYNNIVMARIQSWDESSSTGQGFLTFHTHLHNTGLQEHLRIMNDGKIGIGATSPAAKLHISDTYHFTVAGGNSTTGMKIGNYDGSTYGKLTTRGSELRFDIGDINKMVLDSNGNLGIGTTSPNNKLDVNGGIVCSPNTDGKDTFELSTHALDEGRLKIKNVDTTTIQFRAGGDSYINGGNVGIGTTSPAQLLHVDGQAKVGTLGVGEDAGSATLGVNGNINISPSGNTTYQKFSIAGSQVTTGSALTVNNYGDVEGDYYFIGVNATLNNSGSNIKTNDAKRHAGLYLDGRMGSVMLTSSQTSTSTINNHYTFDRNGNFTLAGNVVIGTNGAGIDFSATSDASGKTSELLDDYEEGTWTPTFPNNGTGNQALGTYLAEYVKIGRFVYAFMYANISGAPQNNGSTWVIGGLPYLPNYSNLYHHGTGNVTYVGGNNYSVWRPLVTVNSTCYFHRTDGNNNVLKNSDVVSQGMGYWIMGLNYMTSS